MCKSIIMHQMPFLSLIPCTLLPNYVCTCICVTLCVCVSMYYLIKHKHTHTHTRMYRYNQMYVCTQKITYIYV